jgi:hypothetical protein
VPTNNAKPEPHQGTDDGYDDGVEPQWPGEVPGQEVKPDFLGVLKDEYEKQSDSDE